MIVEIGHYALVLALALAIVQGLAPLVGAIRRDGALMAMAQPAAVMQFLLIGLSFAALTYAYVTSDFSVVNVFENSHSLKPMIYKISGVWGNHEGSMLLWVLILALFGATVAVFSHGMPDDLRALVLAVQSWIAAAFLFFVLLTSNPFARLSPAPLEGRDLNPLLQDPGLAIHPPLLYIGYVGLSITFSFAAAALISGRIDAAWARYIRPWTLGAWIFLTLGIAMGSYWAYYTLGWGGFWFWDPVENASLMPWLAATALLHSAAVMEKRDALKIWTIFLAILAFSLSLLGTFLVRSGVLTSVHSFATDPQRGVFILAILVFFIGGSLALFAFRASALKPGGIFAPVSREGALVFNNLLLTTSCATVFIGTLYPLALEAVTGEKISVGAPFFNLTFGPLFIPIILAMPFGQMLAWKRGDLLGAAQRLVFACALGLAGMVVLYALRGGSVVPAILAGLAVYLTIGSFTEIYGRLRGAQNASSFFARAMGLPRSAWGTAIAHAGVGLTLFGLAATGWGVERIVSAKLNEPVLVGPYEVVVTDIAPRDGSNYKDLVAHTQIREGGRVVAEMDPSRRSFTTRTMVRTEAGIVTLGLGQVYMNIADVRIDGAIDLRLYWKPYVALIWLGALVMSLGGLLSMADRRLRIGIAKRAATRVQTAAAE
jgi:cytochrome c-type biogenesis protein CcmF